MKKTCQHFYYLGSLWWFGKPLNADVENIWLVASCGNSTAQECKRLQGVVDSDPSIRAQFSPSSIGPTREIYIKKAASIIKDLHHPDKAFLSQLSLSRRHRSLFHTTYIPTTIMFLNQPVQSYSILATAYYRLPLATMDLCTNVLFYFSRLFLYTIW